MVVEPKVKGFICTTAHPTGCEKNVSEQIAYVKKQGKLIIGITEFEPMDYTDENGEWIGFDADLVIGASTGYGLASRITAAFGMGAATIGVLFDKEASGKRTATPGFYNTRAFDEAAAREGLYAKSVNGDAFSVEIKQQVIQMIKEDLGKVDMVVYSLASPRRTTADGTTYVSSLKTGIPGTIRLQMLRFRLLQRRK